MTRAWSDVTASPLTWPAGWPRARSRSRSKFRTPTVYAASMDVFNELKKLGVREDDIIISTNLLLRQDGRPRSGQAIPSDPGIAVYFVLKGRPLVLACDTWDRVEDNLRAIVKHVEALRGQQRWGVGSIEQAFGGYAQLPPGGSTSTASRRSWWTVLGFSSDDGLTLDRVQAAYRRLARERHPDVAGGDKDAFVELSRAYDEAEIALGAKR